jgi:hypothetical protein
VFDACEMERRGVPTLTITHEAFLRAARMHARMTGIPDLPLLVEPSPDAGNVGRDVDTIVFGNEAAIIGALLASR